MVRSAGTSGGPSRKKKHPLLARSNAASSLEESRQRCKVSTFGSSGLRTDSGLCRGLKSLQLESHAELATTLNGPVTEVELRYVMKSLKLAKATYIDDVSYDAIKAGFPVIQEALVHLFNDVLNSQVFLEPWNEGLIIPIHKKAISSTQTIIMASLYQAVLINCFLKL